MRAASSASVIDIALVGLDVGSRDGGCFIVGPPEGGAGRIHGYVAASDDDDPIPHLDLKALVGVDEELDGFQDAIGLVSFDVQAAAERGANREEKRIVARLELAETDIIAQLGVEMNLDAEVHDGLQLGVEQVAVEAVLRDAELHHAAELAGRLIDRHLVPMAPQVVGAGHPGRAAADDADALGAVGAGRSGDRSPRLAGSRFNAVLLGNEALEGSNGDGRVNFPPPAGVLTRGGAHPAAGRRERIGQPGRQIGGEVVAVGDGCHVSAGIGMHGTRRQTRDVLVVELQT